jgi:hypothetical protein
MHKKTGLLDREARFAEDLPSDAAGEAPNSCGLPQEWREVSWADASGPEGILVREADGAWVNFNCPGNSMPSFLLSWISVPDNSRRALLVQWLSD